MVRKHESIAGSVIAGVDTHKDTHYAAVITDTGQHLAAAQFPATDAGYRALAAFITSFGDLAQTGMEGTNSYGAGLARHLAASGFEVVEVLRPARQARRRGKSDEIDAYAAAHTALAGLGCSTPKTSDGPVEAIRAVILVRNSAVKAHTEAIAQIKSLLVSAPNPLRSRYRAMTSLKLVSPVALVDDEGALAGRLPHTGGFSGSMILGRSGVVLSMTRSARAHGVADRK